MTQLPSTKVTPDPGVQRAMTVLGDAGLVTTEQARSISVAVSGLQTMQKVATNVGQRHFNQVDLALSVRNPTPTMKAREELSTIGRVWKDFTADFHKYRELFYQIKVMRAKLAKARKALDNPQLTDDDRTILEAELELEQVHIDKVEAEVAAGHAALQQTLTTVKGASERYALVCEKAGKEFTEDDFLLDECDYLIKSAFWHASQTFGYTDISVNQYLLPQDRIRKIRVGQNVLLLFQELGITREEMADELKQQMEQVRAHEFINEGRDVEPEKRLRFMQWVDRMAHKYHDRSLASMKAGGKDRMDRIARIITPTDQDSGKNAGKALDRPNMME